jgi:hypothetical protein
MSDNERFAVYKSLVAFGAVLIAQTIAVAWWAATLQANVTAHDEHLDSIMPRIEILERDYYRRGGQTQ